MGSSNRTKNVGPRWIVRVSFATPLLIIIGCFWGSTGFGAPTTPSTIEMADPESSGAGFDVIPADATPFQEFAGSPVDPLAYVMNAEPGDRTALFSAPANDTCSGAVVIPDGPYPVLSAITSGVDQASQAGDPTASCASYDHGVWYTWVPSASGLFRIESCTGSTATTEGDGVLAVFTSSSGCVGPFTQAACDDDGCHAVGPSNVVVNAVGGTQYYILAGHFNDPGSPLLAQYQLRIAPVLSPVNDTCAMPVPLVLDTPVSAANAGATDNYHLSGSACFTGVGQTLTTAAGRDSVFSFTAPSSGSYSFRAQYSGSGGGNLTIYAASTCPAATPPTPVVIGSCLAASNRNGFSGITATEEIPCLALTGGQTVFVVVDETAASATGGPFTVEATRCSGETEPNNTPATAGALACPLEGSVDVAGDADFFSLFSPLAGSRVFALAEGIAANASGDTQIRVTTSSDTLQFDDDCGTGYSGALSPIIAGTPLPGSGGPFFLRLNAKSPATALEPYRLYATVEPPIDSAIPETEPNDDPPTANSGGALYFSGQLAGPAPSSDVDVYRFCAKQGDAIYIGVDGDPLRDNTPINPYLSLLDDAGAYLAAVNDSRSTSSTAPGSGSLTATTPSSPSEAIVWKARYSGPYYATVRIGTTDTGSAGTGDYLLGISTSCLNGDQQSADLSVNETDAPDPVTTGQDITYSITLTNAGPQMALDTTLINGIPPNTTFQSLVAPEGWTCTAPPVDGEGDVSCTTSCLAPGDPAQFTLVVKASFCQGNGTVTNAASVTSATPDPSTTDNADSTTTAVTDPRSCEDGDVCTTGDACIGTTCVGSPRNCDDGNVCTADECNPLGCVHTSISCNDGNRCTDDTCNSTTGCVYIPNYAGCDDGNDCTTDDRCEAGTCIGVRRNCGDNSSTQPGLGGGLSRGRTSRRPTAIQPVHAPDPHSPVPLPYPISNGPQQQTVGTQMTLSEELHEQYKYLPPYRFPSGLLLDIGSTIYEHLVKLADGTLQSLTTGCLTVDQLWSAYAELQRSWVTDPQKLPEALELYRTAMRVTYNGVNPLALLSLEYDEINPNAWADGYLQDEDEYGTVFPVPATPAGDEDTSDNDDPFLYVKETGLGGNYVLHGRFFAAGFFKADIYGDSDNNLVFEIPTTLSGQGPSSFVITNDAAGVPSTVTDIKIKFPTIALPTIPANEFMPISTDTVYAFNMANAPFVNRVAKITFCVEARVGGGPALPVRRYACGKFTYHRTDDGRVRDCSPRISQAFYPTSQPLWWPSTDPGGSGWNDLTRPSDPLNFFVSDPAAKPSWWPSSIPWPTPAAVYKVNGAYSYLGRWDGKRIDSKILGPFYDSGTDNLQGELAYRLYPATYRAGESEAERCRAKNLVVVVDGIDLDDSRTADTIYAHFHYPIAKMRDKGYDTLLLDYSRGRDYMERNGYALMEVLKQIPTFMHVGYEGQRAIVVAGSMGTQVSRFALATLEQQGIDHHTGLWIAVDGPFLGAHVPWALQGILKFGAKFSTFANTLLLGLESPASKQLLRRGPSLVPDPEFAKFYNKIETLNPLPTGATSYGLPRQLRKVAIASGSGLGNTATANQGGLSNSFYDLLDMDSISASTWWHGLRLDANTENNGTVLKAKLKVPKRKNKDFHTKVKLKERWSVNVGAQPLDYSPGGYNTAPQLIVKLVNETAGCSSSSPELCMTSGLDHFNFIPTFSSLFYRPAILSNVTLDFTKHSSGFLSSATTTWTTTQQDVNAWYATESSSAMNPSVKVLSPFDSIWYQRTNHEHVISPGQAPPLGEEEFLFNEMDRFTSQEEYSRRASQNPKIQSAETFFMGDITGYGIGELFAANVFTKKAMVQRFTGGAWQTIWESLNSKMIGAWTIDKGDRFYFVDLVPSRTGDLNPDTIELLSVSTGVPAHAMVQRLIHYDSGGQVHIPPFWETLWDNGGDGYLGSWKIHSTDLYAFGVFSPVTTKKSLLAAYPYIGNNERERVSPGAGGLSEAMALALLPSGGQLGDPYQWVRVWGNDSGGYNTPHTINVFWPIRFGDHMDFMRLVSGEAEQLLSVNLLRDIFCCFSLGDHNPTARSVFLQRFVTSGNNSWLAPWINSDPVFGAWDLGLREPEEAFHKIDIDGDGIDEVLTVNESSAYIQRFNSGVWQLAYSSDPFAEFGFYHLHVGDRFYVGDIDGDSQDEVLSWNPDNPSPAVLQKYDPMSAPFYWQFLWYDHGNHMLGNWLLYER